VGKGTKGGDKGDGKGKGTSKFTGECFYCGKTGRRANECWSKAAATPKGKGKGVGSVEEEEDPVWVLSAVSADPVLGQDRKKVELRNRCGILQTCEKNMVEEWPEMSECRCEPCGSVRDESVGRNLTSESCKTRKPNRCARKRRKPLGFSLLSHEGT
jgi:hypothetical protein